MVAEGNTTLEITNLIANTTRYSVSATEPRLSGQLYVMQVSLRLQFELRDKLYIHPIDCSSKLYDRQVIRFCQFCNIQ